MSSCVGCGWCCLTDQCGESHRLHGYVSRCPEVFWHEGAGQYRCRLMMDPELGEHYRNTLHSGDGCCAPLNQWRDDVRNRDKD